MGQTTLYQLPYPEPTDPADVPLDMRELAEKIDGLLAPPVTSALPATPVDGQEIYYQNATMVTAGVVWHLRYRAGSASTYKWEFVGGGRLINEIAALETISTAGYADLATPGPQLNAPLAGEYLIVIAATLQTFNGVNALIVAAPTIGGTAPAAADNIALQNPTNAGFAMAAVSRELRRTVTSAGGLVKLQYAQSGGNGSAQRRSLSLLPARVG